MATRKRNEITGKDAASAASRVISGRGSRKDAIKAAASALAQAADKRKAKKAARKKAARK